MSVIKPRLDDGEDLRRHPALGAIAALGATLINIPLEPYIGHTPTLFVYLAALLVTGPLLDRGGVFVQAAVSVAAWDFLFTRPRFSFAITEKEDVALALLFILTTFAVARLARSARRSETAAHRESERLRAIHDIVREIAAGRDRHADRDAALKRLGEAYDADATFFVFDKTGRDPAEVAGATPAPEAVDEARRHAEERTPLHRFVEIPDRGLTQHFVLPLETGVAVLRLGFRVAQPDYADRTETLRLVTYLLSLAPAKK